MISVSMRVLIVWALFVIAATLAPFDFSAAASVHEYSLKLVPHGWNELDPIHLILNLLLFTPLGVFLHHEGLRRSVKLRSIVLVTAASGFAISASVEYMQAFLPSRDSSLTDVLTNTAGAVMGIAADRSWGASVEGWADRLRAGTSPAMLATFIAAFLGVALPISGALQAGTRLSNWSTEYPLLIGNEHTGDRPWRGRLFTLAITDEATPLELIRRFSAGQPIVLPGSVIGTFDFSGNAPYRDATGNLPDLDWTDHTTASRTGVALTGRPWLRTAGAASRLAHRLRETNAFTLRISCATDNANQDGPARIISNSVSPYLRNLTLGQQGDALVVRLRTPQTGTNGYPLETIVPGVFSADRPRDILVTYDGATLLIAVAQTNRMFRTELTPAATVALLIATLRSQTVHADELQTYKMAYLAALFLPPGVLVGLLGQTRRDRRRFSVVYPTAAAMLLEITLTLASGRAFDWGNVAVTAGVGAVVLTLVSTILSQPDLQRNPGRGWRFAAETWS